jgi:hypothetical protein
MANLVVEMLGGVFQRIEQILLVGVLMQLDGSYACPHLHTQYQAL